MNILLDTHIAMWAVTNDPRLPQKARKMLEDPDNEIYYSTASIWETTIKHMLHPEHVLVNGRRLAFGCEQDGYIFLPILNRRVLEVETLRLAENAPPA